MEINKRVHLLIGITGSVATIKIQELIQKLLQKKYFQLKVITTENAKKFIDFQDLKKKYQQNIQFYQDSNQYQTWKKRGDSVLHIQLRKWADIYLLAPLSANTLAKLANGISDNLITLVFRCWNFELSQNQTSQKKLKFPVLLCPAMNVFMYAHPITIQHFQKLKKWNCTIIDSVQKILMCGEKGKGAMQSVDNIIMKVEQVGTQIMLKDKNN